MLLNMVYISVIQVKIITLSKFPNGKTYFKMQNIKIFQLPILDLRKQTTSPKQLII